VGILALGSAASAQVAQPGTPMGKRATTLWSGQSGGYAWKWNTLDITASAPGAAKPRFSAMREIRKAFGKPEDHDVNSYYEVNLILLCVAGSLACYRRDDYWEGGAHPSGSISFMAVDMKRPGRKVKLTDLFPDREILKALLVDRVVQKVMQREKMAPPRTAAALANLLKYKEFGGETDSMYSFPENLLEQFAIHHIENGQVAVRLNVPWGTEIYRYNSTQIGLLLPIPAAWRSALAQADSRQQGFLMKDAKAIARDRTARMVPIDKIQKP
jgi:hypothetical protein